MKWIKKNCIIFLILFLIIISLLRIKAVNKNNQMYETSEIPVEVGESINIEDIEYTLKEIVSIEEIYKEDMERNYIVTTLAIQVKNIGDKEIDLLEKKYISFFAKYQNFSSYMMAETSKNDVLLAPNKEGTILVEVEFAKGKFYNYYNHYDKQEEFYLYIKPNFKKQEAKQNNIYKFKIIPKKMYEF